MTKRYLNTPEEVVQALQAGKKVQTDYMEYWFSKGVFFSLNKKDGYVCINSNLLFVPCMYVDEHEPFKLEVGKFYKTREGLKVITLCIDKNNTNVFPVRVAVVDSQYASYHVKETGEYSNCVNSKWDLVAPWEE